MSILSGVKLFFEKNRVFSLMLIGSLLSLIINIMLKKYYDDSVYATYVMFLVLFSYSAFLSTLCSDQVFLRYYDVENNLIQSPLVKVIFISSLIGVIALICLAIFIFGTDGFLYYLMFCIFSPVFILVPQVLRIKSFFVLSVLFSHFWKLFLIILITIYFFLEYELSVLSVVVVSFFISYSILFCYVLKKDNGKKIRINISKMDVPNSLSNSVLIKTQAGFIFSYFNITLITNIDKIILNYYSSAEELANYAFTFLLLTYPVTLMSGYFGFKDLVKYKKNLPFSIEKEMVKALKLVLPVFLATSFAVFFLKDFINLKWDWYLFCLFLFFSLIKATYSQTSSLVIARVKASILIKYNLASLLFMLLFCLLYLYFLHVDSRSIATLFTILWLVRWAIYYKLAKVYS